MGVGSDLEVLSAKVVLLALILPLLMQMMGEARSVNSNGIQVGH